MLSFFALPIFGLTWQSTFAQPAVADCASFAASLQLEEHHTTIINATDFAMWEYEAANTIPFCQIFGNVSYGEAGDYLVFEIWLPDAQYYHGRFLAVGNGGFAGVLEPAEFLAALNLDMGFAIAGGDAGHRAALNGGAGAAPGEYIPFLHDPAQTQAWIHNGISLFTGAAKAITRERYGSIDHSYYDGCSTGGGQGFALAQRHPHLYDGIIAGSPGNYYSHLMLSGLWFYVHTNTPATAFSVAQLNAMTAAVVAACSKQGLVSDGVIQNPLACRFDVDSFGCQAANPALNASTCLSPAQLLAARAVYAGPRRTDTGAQIYPGFSLGSESSWTLLPAIAESFASAILQNLVFDDLTYNISTFNFGSDVDTLNQRAGTKIDDVDPALESFHHKGGKLLVYQGWADQINAAAWPIEHLYQSEAVFGCVEDWYELFMIPGAGHCGLNTAYPQTPTVFNTLQALVPWVENGVRPTQIEANTPMNGANITVKLCPWPQTARYSGGSADEWTSYVCR
ncbi:hypothetical protein ANO11243_018040 [Dothideomycetidae sp. 11243]|nr:hypothetical protein ANO11243_018040 [fungal sp. No.11243]